jgi:predicted alpha/beta-fold hydrolase
VGRERSPLPVTVTSPSFPPAAQPSATVPPSVPPFVPPFVPAVGRGTVQTLLAGLPRPALRTFARRAQPRLFRIDDDNAVEGRLHRQPGTDRAPLAVLLHGLTGDADAGYVLGTAAKLFAAGFDVLRLNTRNCGGTEPLTQTLYHGALSTDPLAVLRELAAEDPQRSLHLVGFSLGGSLALLLATTSADVLPRQLVAVAAVSAPLDLARCSRRLHTTAFGRWLTRRFLAEFERLFARRERLFPGRIDLAAFRRDLSLWEFDARFTAPHAGFRSVEEYYAAGTVAGRLSALPVPTLLVQALDDPLVEAAGVLAAEVAGQPRLRPLITLCGGHVGFFGARRARGPRGPDPDRRWAENRVVDFLVEQERGPVG